MKVGIAILAIGLACTEASPATGVRGGGLRCEYLENPLGIDVVHPRLGWMVESGEQGQKQTAYRILVAESEEALARNEGGVWDSGKVESDRSVLVPYAGGKLRPKKRYFWKVRIWDKDGVPSPWSNVARWSTGLPKKIDARWIGAGSPMKQDPWLRKRFVLAGMPEDAQAYVASMGYHELFINGKKVGDSVLEPSTSLLSKRVRYVTYDIAPYLCRGTNVVAFWLGTGWAGWKEYHVQDKPLVLAEIDVMLPGSEPLVLNTDESWKIHPSCSALLGEWRPGNYGGEQIDCRRVLPQWNSVGFDDSAWAHARVFDPEVECSAEMIEPNRKMEMLEPVAIDEVAPKVYRVDMGRSFSGWNELQLRGQPDQKIILSFSERPDQKSTYGLQSRCILDGQGRGFFRNRFNYSAGRWITIEGLDRPPPLSAIRGYVVRNAYRRTGHFACSNPLLNRIYDTVLWTFESLSLGGYVVDCPHRERMGYGGDAHATMETALDSYGLGAFYTKWIGDWRDVQKPDGDLPYTAPTLWGGGGPAWSGICVALPWTLHERLGDLRILEETYPVMQRWINFLDTKSRSHLLEKWGGEWDFLGDWVPPRKPGGDYRVDDESALFFNNGYYLYNVRMVAEVAERLGKSSDAKNYREKAEKIRAAIQTRFYHPETRTYAGGSQLDLAFPLLAGVPPEKLRPAIIQALEKEILVAGNGHVDTGIHGTWFLIKTLMALDRNDLVFAMASKTDFPSWGHMLEQGATTIWEEWDGEHSLLHSSFLSIGAWFIEGVAGIQPDPRNPGYKHFFIKPGVVGDLAWAKGELDTLHGKISSHWKLEGDALLLDILVPPNTTATVHVPARTAAEVAAPEGAQFQRLENGRALFSVDSGRYRFRSPAPRNAQDDSLGDLHSH